MVADSSGLERELETLARAKSVVIHRSPARERIYNRCDYFVCDCNNFVLFPRQNAQSRGATAEETRTWLLANQPSVLALAN